jgi:hypothetical protein
VKSRCAQCGQIVETKEQEYRYCPFCHTAIPETRPTNPGKGALPTHNAWIENVGCVAAFLVLGVSGSVAGALQGKNDGAMLTVALGGVVAALVVGVWFHNRARRR